jgi:hypothetical protein
MGEFNAILTTFTNIATGVAVAAATFFFVISAIEYAASGGNPVRKMKGQEGMTAAVVGLGLVFAARIIMSVIQGAIPH